MKTSVCVVRRGTDLRVKEACALLAVVCLACAVDLSGATRDALVAPDLKNCRVDGAIGAKFDRFIYERCLSVYARNVIFREARDAFAHPDDDICTAPIGTWKGEFWGKLMLSSARVAEYQDDAAFKEFLRQEAHRLMRYQKPDGYLGSYVNPEFVCAVDRMLAEKANGWGCDFCWNLWCRKYTTWGLVAAARLTGDREILAAADRLMAQQIEMLRRLGVKLCDTGTTAMVGLPSCSILKPLIWLYQDTGKVLFLDYAKEIVSYWDRPGNPAPNFFANVDSGKPMHEWYPSRLGSWGKAYEMMSCLDGVLEYYRVTGERRCLEMVSRLQEMLWTHERNLVESVGYNDQFVGATRLINGASEPCDAIHWIRLNFDLYLITGDVRYVNAIEPAFYNALLAGVYRDGRWGARQVRSAGRHVPGDAQCGLRLQHCCVNTMPRSFMDIAQLGATQEADGTTRVNLYNPFTTDFSNVCVKVVGDYRYGDFPTSDRVTVELDARCDVRVRFRLPPWSKTVCFQRLPEEKSESVPSDKAWHDVVVKAGRTAIRVRFDMSPRIEPPRAPIGDELVEKYAFRRWCQSGEDMTKYYRTTPAARLYLGPLLLAKSKNVGDGEDDIFRTCLNGGGWAVRLERMPNPHVQAAWRAAVTRGDETYETNVCDFPSAGDSNLPVGAAAFSIFF